MFEITEWESLYIRHRLFIYFRGIFRETQRADNSIVFMLALEP